MRSLLLICACIMFALCLAAFAGDGTPVKHGPGTMLWDGGNEEGADEVSVCMGWGLPVAFGNSIWSLAYDANGDPFYFRDMNGNDEPDEGVDFSLTFFDADGDGEPETAEEAVMGDPSGGMHWTRVG